MLEHEVGIELSNAVEDIHEQTLAHPIPALKIVGMYCVICEVVIVQHGISGCTMPPSRAHPTS
jgi:hypothetical protein